MPEPRYPFIARVCLWLNALFALLWALYLLGPDVGGMLLAPRGGVGYRIFAGTFFVAHFVLISTGIIALFVVIIEVYGRRPVRGFKSVLMALALPIASFLYFAIRFLGEVERWGALQGWDGR